MRARAAFRAVLCLLPWGPALLACAAAPSAAGACRVSTVDSLSLRSVREHPVVSVYVNGEPVSMLLDTGAETSAVTRATVARLGLPAASDGTDTVTGLDGARSGQAVRASLSLSGRGRPFRVLVADLPADLDGIAGLVGADVLSGYDLDLDQPGKRLTLLRAENCAAGDTPWPGRSRRLPAAFTPRGLVLVAVEAGGTTLQARVDTGVDRSVLDSGAAQRAGLTEADIAAGAPSSFLGAGLRPVTMRGVLLRNVRIGSEQLLSLPAEVPDAALPGPAMLLGNDYLSRRRLLVSWQRQTVFARTED